MPVDRSNVREAFQVSFGICLIGGMLTGRGMITCRLETGGFKCFVIPMSDAMIWLWILDKTGMSDPRIFTFLTHFRTRET